MSEAEIQELLRQEPMPAEEAARRCGVEVERIVRWILRGKNGVFLKGYHAGRKWMVTVESLAAFLAQSPRLRKAPAPVPDPALARVQAEGRRRLAEARAKLRAGI